MKDRHPTDKPAATDAATAPRTGGALFPVVGIGGSAGGLPAFEAFFEALPAESPGMAFMVVQHMSPGNPSVLPTLLGRYTRLPVVEAEQGMPVRPDHVYVMPPGSQLAVSDGVVQLSPRGNAPGPHLPVDHLFRSLAATLGERAICVVMSGTGTDGTLGLRAVKGEGGLAVVQAPDSAQFDGMPRSAIDTGLADYVLAPAQMPTRLLAYARGPFGLARRRVGLPAQASLLRRLCTLLRAQVGHDFSQYKESTLVRRLQRRMALNQIEDPEAYLTYARERPAEVDALFRDLLIGVTSFFRDPDAFEALQRDVVPRLLRDRPPYEPLRAWVCACSTGEEAYSLAIVLHEAVSARKLPLKIQLFATDIDATSIAVGRAGVYPASIAADVSPERLARYFTSDESGSTYRIDKAIRDLVVFSEQDVIKDPPFSKLDLVSCRNLLIYLDAALQRRLIPLFHYALAPGGTLLLGTSETVGDHARLFGVIDRQWKLYRRLEADSGHARPLLGTLVPPPHLPGPPGPPKPSHDAAAPVGPPGRLRELTEQALLAHYTQAAVLVNARGEVLHIYGRTGRFLEPAAGDAAFSLLPMARDGLRRELTVALHKAIAHKQPVSYRRLQLPGDGHPLRVSLTVRPAGGAQTAAADLYLVVFEEEPPDTADTGGAAAADAAPAGQAGRIAELELELRSKDEYLQTTLEEMETANEELKSANEEMQSVNEELQSTNEELETSKEELQSVNEELSTVNAELQDKVAELSRANNDMSNLLAGTGVGTLFVDRDLRISRFTPAIAPLVNLIPSDVGRPLPHLRLNLVGPASVVDDIQLVLATLEPHASEVQTTGGQWYLMGIGPYRTLDNQVEGAVLTLVDISDRRQAEQALRRSEARLNAYVHHVNAGIAELDTAGRIVFANQRLCGSADRLVGRHLNEVVDADDLPRAALQYELLLGGGPAFQIELRMRRADGAPVWMHQRVSAIRAAGGAPASALMVCFDLSERKRVERELAERDPPLAGLLEAISRLQTLNSMVVGVEQLEAAMQQVIDVALVICPAPVAEIRLARGPGGAAAARPPTLARRGDAAEALPGDADAGPGWAAALAQPGGVGVADVETDAMFDGSAARTALRKAGLRALHATPLFGRDGRRLGTLLLGLTEPGRLEARQSALLDVLARQAAGIAERALAAALVQRGPP